MALSSINKNIKGIRELKNYTQQYMAQGLGITQAGYSKIEKAKTSLSYEKLEKIALILDVNVQTIVCFDAEEYLRNFKNKEYGCTQNGVINSDCKREIEKLYKDKIVLLEKLLTITSFELKRYKEKYEL